MDSRSRFCSLVYICEGGSKGISHPEIEAPARAVNSPACVTIELIEDILEREIDIYMFVDCKTASKIDQSVAGEGRKERYREIIIGHARQDTGLYLSEGFAGREKNSARSAAPARPIGSRRRAHQREHLVGCVRYVTGAAAVVASAFKSVDRSVFVRPFVG